MSALFLAAVDRTRREARVADAADHLVAVVLTSQHLESRLDDSTSQSENQVKGGLLLDVVVGKRASILELLSREDQSLLIRGNSLLILDLGLDVIDGVSGLHIEGNGLTRKSFDENLHLVWSRRLTDDTLS